MRWNIVRIFLILVLPWQLVFLAPAGAEPGWKEDTAKVTRMILRSWRYLENDIDSSQFYAQRALNFSKEISYQAGVAMAYVKLAEVEKTRGNFEEALDYLQKALDIREGLGLKSYVARTYSSIANLYLYSDNHLKARINFQNAINKFSGSKDKLGLATANLNLGNFFLDIQNPDSAFIYFDRAQELYHEIGYEAGEVKALTSKGNAAFINGNLKQAEELFNAAISRGKNNRSLKDLITAYNGLAGVAFNRGDYKSAEEQYLKALEVYKDLGSHLDKEEIYKNLSYSLYFQERYKDAYDAYENYSILKDSLFTVEKNNQLLELGEKYNNEKLKYENFKKAALLKQKNWILLGGALILFLSGLVIYVFWQRHRMSSALAIQRQDLLNKTRENHEKDIALKNIRIDDLLREIEIERLNALMEGQEKERKRIAEDLHDRLGSLLSIAKLHFSTLEEKISDWQNESREQYQKGTQLLENAFDEVRRISHEMASGNLEKYGLVAALEDLRDSISSANQIHFELDMVKMNERIDRDLEINIYRVIQELVSNILKHSNSTEIELQLVRHNSDISISITDNGDGFDPEKVQRGMGLKNIRSRISKFNGKLHIDSSVGKGTTVFINIPFTKKSKIS